MQNMKKLKEDALRRKHEFEEKQRHEELQKQRKMRGGSSRPDRKSSSQSRRRQEPKQEQQANARIKHKKPKKTPARWVLDTLLVLGTLIALVMLFNPY